MLYTVFGPIFQSRAKDAIESHLQDELVRLIAMTLSTVSESDTTVIADV